MCSNVKVCSTLGDTAWIDRVAEQQEVEVFMLSFYGMLASRRESSLRLLVPAANSQSAEVPPSGVAPMTTDIVNSNGCHDICQNRSSLRYSGPTPRSALRRCDRSVERVGANSRRSVSLEGVCALEIGMKIGPTAAGILWRNCLLESAGAFHKRWSHSSRNSSL